MTASVAEGNAIVSWLVMILLSIPLAFTFAFLSIEYSSAGGIATFAEKAFGKNIGAIIGWCFFIAGSVGQIVVSMTGGIYIVRVFALSVIGTKSYHINADNTTALVLVMKQTLGEQFAWIIGFVAFIICLGTTNAFIASMGRLGYSLGKAEVAPHYLAHINKKRETPTNALKVVGCTAIIGLLISFVFHISIDKIVLIPNSLGIVTYIVGTAAGMKLIKNRLGKIFSIVAFTCCVVVYPFIGGVILIPVAVAFICLWYVCFSSRRI